MDVVSSLFKKKKTPEQIVSLLKRGLVDLSAVAEASYGNEKEIAKLQEEIAKRVDQLRACIWGDPDGKDRDGALHTPHGSHGSLTSLGGGSGGGAGAGDAHDPVCALAEALMAEEIMPLMLTHIRAVDFETRKGISSIFNHLLRNDVRGFASSYMAAHTGLLYQMADGYSSPDVALCCGGMLREAIRVPHLHAALLYGPDGGISGPLHSLFEEHVHNPNFEVSADAFETLTQVLTSNKPLVFSCLNPDGDEASLARYNELFAMYNRMLQSDNYVLKRQSLKLLSEFLLDRENFRIMMKYISDKNNLKIIMMMLRHKQPNIQFEAFHVFKVFVANPEKPADVAEILAANKGKLIAFLQAFQNDKDFEQFTEEKAMLVDTLQRLPDMAVPATPVPGAAGLGASLASSAGSLSASGAGEGAAAAGGSGFALSRDSREGQAHYAGAGAAVDAGAGAGYVSSSSSGDGGRGAAGDGDGLAHGVRGIRLQPAPGGQ